MDSKQKLPVISENNQNIINMNRKIKLSSLSQLDLSEKDLLRAVKICYILNIKWFAKYMSKHIEREELLTSKEVMSYLRISKTTLYRYVRDEKLLPIDVESRKHKFLKSEVESLKTRKNHVR